MRSLLQAGFLAVLLLAAWSDLRSRRIPNAVVVSAALFAILSQLPVISLERFWHLAAAALLSMGLLLPLWQLRLLGGGDLKLFVATSLWAGLDWLLELALAVALAGGGLALLSLAGKATRRKLLPLIAAIPHVGPLVPATAPSTAALTESSQSRASLPYAVAITAGAFWLWVTGEVS